MPRRRRRSTGVDLDATLTAIRDTIEEQGDIARVLFRALVSALRGGGMERELEEDLEDLEEDLEE